MHRGTWKAFERRIAKDWASVRNALSGGNSKLTRSDSLHPELFISCKHGKRSAFWTLYKEELPKAQAEDKTLILCLGNQSHEGYILAVHAGDLGKVVRAYLRAKGHSDLAVELTRRSKASSRKKP